MIPNYYKVPGYGTVRDFTSALADRDRLHVAPSVNNIRADAIEYLARFPQKNGVEDLKKAARCIEEMIERMQDASVQAD